MDCSRSHTFKNNTPSFFGPPADFNLIGAKTIYSSGVKCRLVEAQSGRGQVCHPRNLRVSTPLPTVRALPLVTSDSFSATDDPILAADFSEYSLWAGLK